jgi:hypothetical protein
VPLAVIDFAALSPAHLRSQVDPVEQVIEHEPLQTMWQVELPAQLMLPLAPSVTLQVEPESQARLQEAPQLPLQSLWSVQLMVQLVGPQLLGVIEHGLALPLQLQVEPLHDGGEPLEPHPATASAAIRANMIFIGA